MARLLVVDDDRTFTEPFETFFSERGHKVVTLKNGDALSELLKAHDFDVVILDNYLDGQSGVEILHLFNRLEEDTGWKKPPIVLLTGDYSMEMEVRARLAKTDFFLLKPCNYSELEGLIEEILKAKQVENSCCENGQDCCCNTLPLFKSAAD